MNYEALFKELARQIEQRRIQATELYFDLNGSDPAINLPLTEYQKGFLNGRIATFEFVCNIITELKLGADKFEVVKEEDQTGL